jgi:hypothetical protein
MTDVILYPVLLVDDQVIIGIEEKMQGEAYTYEPNNIGIKQNLKNSGSKKKTVGVVTYRGCVTNNNGFWIR